MSSPPNPFSSPYQFLRLATLFEGGLMGVAFLLGWVFNINPVGALSVDAIGLAAGFLGTVPLYVLFAASYRMPHAGMENIRRFLLEKLGPLLAGCRWPELLYLGMLAGVSEEILFRGFLQTWLERDWGWAGGILFSNLIFALVHWVTPLYALLAGLTGAYLAWTMDLVGERNLLIPIMIHGIYDFLAFLVVAETYRRRERG